MSSLKLSVTQKRTAIIFSVIIFTFAVMFTKVFLTSTKSELQAVAQNQSTYSLTATQNRGYIYDCNLKPLVNEKSGYMLAVAPSNTAASALLPTVKTKDERDSLMTLFESGRPFLYKTDAPSVYAQGVNVISTKVRYGEKALAPHIIGHLDGGGEGVTGIEKAYNDLLCQNSNSVKITYTVDALRRPIEGKPPTVKTGGETQKGVVLTLDKEIQKIIEEEGARLIEKGAIVVTETATGKIRGRQAFPALTKTM